MSYCLLNKFRGAWLGSLIGEGLTPQIIRRTAEVSSCDDDTEFSACMPHQKLANKHQSLLIPWSTQEIKFIKEKQENLAKNLKTQSVKSQLSKLILSILPVIIYYHDDWHYLSAFLQQDENTLSQHQSEIDSILVWSYVVRLALRGEIVSHSLNGLTYRVAKGTGLNQASAIQWLEQVEKAFFNGFSYSWLSEELSYLKNQEIPLSLFCFLNNSEDFYLTIQQALSLEEQDTNIAVLSGVLSGAYNGWMRIPIYWRNWLQNQDFYLQTTEKIEATIKEWLGVESISNTMALSSVISSPKIFQSRSSLNIISQQEY